MTNALNVAHRYAIKFLCSLDFEIDYLQDLKNLFGQLNPLNATNRFKKNNVMGLCKKMCLQKLSTLHGY